MQVDALGLAELGPLSNAEKREMAMQRAVSETAPSDDSFEHRWLVARQFDATSNDQTD